MGSCGMSSWRKRKEISKKKKLRLFGLKFNLEQFDISTKNSLVVHFFGFKLSSPCAQGRVSGAWPMKERRESHQIGPMNFPRTAPNPAPKPCNEIGTLVFLKEFNQRYIYIPIYQYIISHVMIVCPFFSRSRVFCVVHPYCWLLLTCKQHFEATKKSGRVAPRANVGLQWPRMDLTIGISGCHGFLFSRWFLRER